MSEQELILKTNEELAAVAEDLYSKKKIVRKQTKLHQNAPNILRNLQTVIKIIKKGRSNVG